MVAFYKNPWHNPHSLDGGPATYVTEVTPTAYRDFLIYHRCISGWDIVKDGVCISQRAGFNGAKRFIDQIYQEPDDYFVRRALGYLEQFSEAAA